MATASALKELAKQVVSLEPPVSDIEDDVSLCLFVRDKLGADLTLMDANELRAFMEEAANVKSADGVGRYLIQMFGGTDPYKFGPYPDDTERLYDYRRIVEEEGSSEHVYVRLDIDKDGKPHLSAFSSYDEEEE